jgi:hypothetical protein
MQKSSIASHPSSIMQVQRPAARCQRGCHTNYLRDRIVMRGNRNGNADRPYKRCTAPGCYKFSNWCDNRGVYANNPACECGFPSRLGIAGREHPRHPRALHFECSHGGCDFWAKAVTQNGERAIANDAFMDAFARLRFE